MSPVPVGSLSSTTSRLRLGVRARSETSEKPPQYVAMEGETQTLEDNSDVTQPAEETEKPAKPQPAILKCDFLTKRAQNKKFIGPVNYKSRWFILTPSHLHYYDGNHEKRGKEMGKVDLRRVKLVESVSDSSLDHQKRHVFQVSHDDHILYIIANSEKQRDEWIRALRDACLSRGCKMSNRCHPSLYQGGKWACCGQASKQAGGCQPTFIHAALDSHSHYSSSGLDLTTGHTGSPSLSAAAPTTSSINFTSRNGNHKLNTQANTDVDSNNDSPAQETRKVIALYPFIAIEEGDLSLEKGEEYELLDDAKPNWWKVQNKSGHIGFIPSNFVEVRTLHGLEQYDWYMKGMTRQRCEIELNNEGTDGTFMVRVSSTPGFYTLSLYSKSSSPCIKHYHIKMKKGRFYLSEKVPFESIPDLITYYKHNSAGLITRLRHPPTKLAPASAGLGHDKWEIDPSELTLKEELGSGQFGVVRKGQWRGSIDVAVKLMKEGSMSEDEFIEEAKVMTKLQHPNLVQLYGVITKTRPICIVTEYMKYGSLLMWLRRHEGKITARPALMLDICHQICSAMAYLEANNFIHRDLAARNCLVGSETVVKVADFGLARYVLDDQYTSSRGTKFPIKWAPPEVLLFTLFSSKSDVWAYGVLMWEVWTCGRMPYGRLTNAEVAEMVQRGKKLECPKNCPREVFFVMRKCWESHADRRPSFYEIREKLVKIADACDYK